MNRNIKLGGLDKEGIVMGAIAVMMREHCYLEGTDWMKYMEVTLKPGENIKRHKHRYHAVLYYPDAAEPIIVTPEPGTIISMPPGTYHEVPPVKSDRRSIAMIIEEPKCKST